MPFFFVFNISKASSVNPGAITPSETSLFIKFAVSISHISDNAIKSPNDDILSAPLALAYALASGDNFPKSSTQYILANVSSNSFPTAAPAGDTCLNDVAAGSPVASFNSLTNCHPLKASKKFIYPGFPFKTFTGSCEPSSINILDGF